MSFHLNHNPFIRRRIVSIDSRFRDPVYVSPSDFVYPLTFPIRNVISVRMSSIEFPNTYFVFSADKGNTTMSIAFPGYAGVPKLTITIGDANYSTIPGDTDNLVVVIATAIQNAYLPYIGVSGFPDPMIDVSINTRTGHVTIGSYSSPPVPFTLDFTGGQFDRRAYDWGLGYNLGFPNKEYPIAATSFTGSAIIDTIGPAYLLLQLNGIEPIQHYTPDKNMISAFAKLVMVGNKNEVIYDDGSSYNTKEYRFQQPIDFFQIHPRIVDTYGETVDLNGKNYSFTLEIEEIINMGAYKQYRDMLLTRPADWVPTYAV